VKYAKTLVALAAVAATVVPVLRSAGAESAPTRGRIPESSFRAGLTRANVPDFIVAYGRDGDPAGYVRADDMFPQDGKPPAASGVIVVVDDTLTRVVGHMYPGKGFVPAGQSPDAVPAASVPTTLKVVD